MYPQLCAFYFVNRFAVKKIVHLSPLAKHRQERNIKRTEIPIVFVLETTGVPTCASKERTLALSLSFFFTYDCMGHATRARSAL